MPMPPRPEPEGETHGPGWVGVGAREQGSRKRGKKGMGKRQGKEATGQGEETLGRFWGGRDNVSGGKPT